MKIAIVGGGLSGLTLGYYLSKNHHVVVFEKKNKLGGLAAGFEQNNWSWALDDYYHHFFSSDKELKELLIELAIDYFFASPKSANWQKNKAIKFDSPLDLLSYPYLTWWGKIRLAVGLAYLKIIPSQKWLPNQSADEFLPRLMGREGYRGIWQPLLQGKFGYKAKQISSIWFWSRIKKRTSRLGYIKGGFQRLSTVLADKIKENGGEIKLNNTVESVNQLKDFDRIIATMATTNFLKIIPTRFQSYYQKRLPIEYWGTINLILTTVKPFLSDNIYWLNINEPSFPFVTVVEQTNFVNKKYYGDDHVIYLGGYYSPNHRYFNCSKDEILAEFWPYLKKINPSFKKSFIKRSFLNHSFFAQPLVFEDYARRIPPFKTPVKNVYLLNMEQTYPWDRGVDNAIRLAKNLERLL